MKMTGTALTNASSRAVSTNVDDPFSVQGTEGNSGNVNYVKFTGQSGLFQYGKDEDELKHGTELAIDMMNAQYVWTFWWDGEVMEQFSDPLVENPFSYDNPPMELPEDPNGDINMTIEEIMQARKDDPSNFRDGWSVQASFNGRPTDGTEEEFCLKLNMGVAMNSFHSLRKAFGRGRKLNEGKTPIVEISATSYEPKAKSAGKKRWAPSLKITSWVTEEELAGMVGENPADYDAPDTDTSKVADKATADTSKDTAKPKASTDGADEKPATTGRRGRRGSRGQNVG